MIVVAILGLLVGVALPQFLGTRSAGAAGAALGEIVGLSKECATYLTTGGVGTPITGCSTSTGATFVRTWSGTVAGLKCLTTVEPSGVSKATITVSSVGVMTCSFG